MDREAAFIHFKWSLQAMACNSETQISLFPDFIVASDEIINDFEHWRRAVERYKSEFSQEQIESLRQIHILIGKITKSEEEIWDNNSLIAHELWGELRNAGTKALKEFNWKLEAPSTSRSIFVTE